MMIYALQNKRSNVRLSIFWLLDTAKTEVDGTASGIVYGYY